MSKFYRCLFAVSIIILQFSILPRINLTLFEPDLLLVLTIIFGFFHGIETGCLFGFISGLLMDVSTSILLGSNAFIFTQIGLSAALIRERFMIDNISIQSILVGCCCLMAGLFKVVFQRFSAITEPMPSVVLTIITQAVVNAIISIPLIVMLTRLRWIPERRSD
ncbi:rod shape-determining protein MreD [bacterium]|nr:rod shape-determining protein MreD [candidate division CSSED10-310 bacterium]